MRLGRFLDGTPRACLAVGDHAVDLSKTDEAFPADVLALLDEGHARNLGLIARGNPPQAWRRRPDNVAWLPPLEPSKVVLKGGVDATLDNPRVFGHGDRLPAGSWSTGVAGIVGHGKKHLAGYTVFHRVGDHIALGPWLVDRLTVTEPRGLHFSAFLNDEPVIRPVKALMDWDGELAAAGLKPGDALCLAAPARDGTGDVRSALVWDNAVVCRLEATLGGA